MFACGNFNSIFTVYRFFGLDFLNCFPNSFIVHSRPSVLFEPNFILSLLIFFHMRHFDIEFLIFFLFFRSDFSRNGLGHFRVNPSSMANEIFRALQM